MADEPMLALLRQKHGRYMAVKKSIEDRTFRPERMSRTGLFNLQNTTTTLYTATVDIKTGRMVDHDEPHATLTTRTLVEMFMKNQNKSRGCFDPMKLMSIVPAASHHRSRFPAVSLPFKNYTTRASIKHKNYDTNLSFYRSQVGVNAGWQSPEMVMLEMQVVRHLINETRHPLTDLREACIVDTYRIIQNNVLSAQFPNSIDCQKFYEKYPEYCDYSPDEFVAVIFRTPENIKSKYNDKITLRSVTALVFGSGEIIISGIVYTEQTLEIISYIVGVLKEFVGVDDSNLNAKLRQDIRIWVYKLSQSKKVFDPYTLLLKLKQSQKAKK
jgi:hypothetical protein